MIKEEARVLSRKVRKLREAKGWTRANLALKCGYSENWLVHIEAGDMLASLTGLFALAKSLGVHPADLLTEDEDVKKVDGLLLLIKKFINQYKLSEKDVLKWIKIGKTIFANKEEL